MHIAIFAGYLKLSLEKKVNIESILILGFILFMFYLFLRKLKKGPKNRHLTSKVEQNS